MIIKNGKCALPDFEELQTIDIRVENEKIVEIAKDITPKENEKVIDASGLEIYPGAIDSHVHFDEPGFTHREDFTHGSSAAARGGVTTVIDMPCTSLPPVTTLENLQNKLSIMGKHSVVDFALYGGVSGHTVEDSLNSEMEKLAPYVVGFKCYFVSGMDSFTAVDHYHFAQVIEKAAKLGRPVLLHAEDAEYVKPAEKAQKAISEKRGNSIWDDYYNSRPEMSETLAVEAALSLAKGNENTLHIVHIGTAEAAKVLINSGASCETCPHYLAFSKDDFEKLGASLKTAPVVKSQGQSEKIWAMLKKGQINFITSDHAPSPANEKNTGSVWTAYGGIPGTGTLFPYTYSEGYKKGRLSLKEFLRVVCGGQAQRFGLADRKGKIAVGMDADFAAMNPSGTYVVKGNELLSKGDITPFENMHLTGSLQWTMLRGTKIWETGKGITVLAGYGKHQRFPQK